MTDNDIIKALECCCKNNSCEGCPLDYFTFSSSQCASELTIKSLDLINRQNAENKRLRKEVNLVSIQFQDLQERYEEAQTEIERLKGIFISPSKDPMDFCGVLCDYAEELIDKAKSEAYKEFAEMLKNEINIRTTYSREQDKNVMRMIDNLLKEMVGEE